jgi:hypothetical protein
MADKRVNLIISLKDGVSAGLKSIQSGISNTAAAFKKIALAGVAATTAVVGGLVALAKAYSQQESANNKMAATFSALGENGTAAVVKWGAFATSIQRVTTLGDEQVMSLVTLGKTMGITNDKLGDATKGAIGLSKAFGIDLNSAMKMTALAMQGEFTMLQRYIPALRTATTQAEKMAIVQKAMAAGFKVAEAEMDTIAGSFAALKGVITDAMQKAGEVIFGDGGLANGLKIIKERIIEMTEGGAIEKWATKAKAGLDAVLQTVRILADNKDSAKMVLEKLGGVISAFFTDAVSSAANLFLKSAPIVGSAIASAFSGAVKTFFTGGHKATWEQTKEAADSAFSVSRNVHSSKYKEAYRSKISEFEASNRTSAQDSESSALIAKLGLNTDRSRQALEDFKETINAEAERLGISAHTAKEKVEGAFDAVVEAVEEGAAGVAAAAIQQKKGGFAELYQKMTGSGASEYEKGQLTRFTAEQEKFGASQGVSGAGRYAAEQRMSGLSEYDVIQRVQEFVKAEVRGMAAGVQGAGAFAQQLLGRGASSYDVGQAVSGMLSNEGIGQAISGGLSDPLTKISEATAKTSETLESLLNLSQDRMGGVK